MESPTPIHSISSWKRKFVGSIPLNSFHFRNDVKNIYENKTKKQFTDDMCTTLVVYICNMMIQFFNPQDNFRLMEFKFNGLTYDQDSFGISEDGLTFFSRDIDTVVVSTLRGKKEIFPINYTYVDGYFNTIKYSLFGCYVSPQISIPQFSRFFFNKSHEQFALIYNGQDTSYDGKKLMLTKNGKTQVSIHNTFTGSIKRVIEIEVNKAYHLAFSHNGMYVVLIVESDSKNFLIYNTVTGECIQSKYFAELTNICPYQNGVCWSPDDKKIVATVNNGSTSNIIYFENIMDDAPIMSKFVITGAIHESVTWNKTSDVMCFYTHDFFGTIDLKTKQVKQHTLSDKLTEYIYGVCFVTSDKLAVTRSIKETHTFKDKTYKSGTSMSCPPDNEVPYIDIVKY